MVKVKFLKINKMKGNGIKIPGMIPEKSKYYYFYLDLVCRQFLLDDFHFVVHERNLRSAWRKCRSQVQDYIHLMGFKNILVERIIFKSCEVYSLDGQFINSYNKIN